MSEIESGRLISAFEQVCLAERRIFDKNDFSRLSSSLKTTANAAIPTKLIARLAAAPRCTTRWRRSDGAFPVRWEAIGRPKAEPTLSPVFQLPTYSAAQYAEVIAPLSNEWNAEETADLWRTVEVCEGNFVVAFDRHSIKYPNRTIEDLQERVHEIIAALSPAESRPPPFDRDAALANRLNAQKVARRSRAVDAEETALLSAIHRAEARIKQRQKASDAFQRYLSMPSAERSAIVAQTAMTPEQFLQSQPEAILALNSGAGMCGNSPHLSRGQNAKVSLALRKLELIGQVHANSHTAARFEEVKGKLLLLFALHQQLEQRQSELAELRGEEPKPTISESAIKRTKTE